MPTVCQSLTRKNREDEPRQPTRINAACTSDINKEVRETNKKGVITI